MNDKSDLIKAPMYYYHLTTKEALPDILNQGLKPCIGDRSKMAGEVQPAIYMCGNRDIKYWRIILGLPVVLKIKSDNIQLSKQDIYNYSYYQEYMYTQSIPPENISIVSKSCKSYNKEAMHDLCLSYIWTISSTCVKIARYYTYKNTNKLPEWLTSKNLQNEITTTLDVLKKLDYNICTTKEMRKELREAGDGGFAFTDYYNINFTNEMNKRLYTMLTKFEKDELFPYRKELYKNITTIFKKCLDVDTGGWTG